MIRELSLEGFYNWHLRKLDFEAGVFGPNILCKVCARANRAFFALTCVDSIELRHLNDSKICYRDKVVFKSGVPWDLEGRLRAEILYNNLDIAPLDASDIPRIKAAVRFINLQIGKGYSNEYHRNMIENYLDTLDKLERKCSVQKVLEFCGVST